MTWTADQERAHRQAQAQRRRSTELVQTWFGNFISVELAEIEAADIILHADALIALLQPFASAPEVVPEPAAVAATGDADGWIENTGVCPVEKGVRIDMRLLNGDEYFGVGNAPALAWSLSGAGGQITHWRLHKPQESKA